MQRLVLDFRCRAALIAASAAMALFASPRPNFEVASVRPCKPSGIAQGGGKKGGRGGGGSFRASPGRLLEECQTVENLVRWAYLGYPDGKPWPADTATGLPMPAISNRILRQEIKGPGWIASERYTIDAKAAGPATTEMMRGPMMQTLLERRFRLEIRIETRDRPVYFLTVADAAPKLQPSKPGTCMSFAEFDRLYGMEPRKPGRPVPRVCGPFRPTILDRDPNADRAVAKRSIGVDTWAQTISGLCRQFSAGAGRDVIDRTGLAGVYDIHLDLALEDLFDFPDNPDEPAPGPEEKASHIAAAVRKLGLKLEPGNAPAPFVVVEHVERPTEN